MKNSIDYYVKEFIEGKLEQERGTWEVLGRSYIKK